MWKDEAKLRKATTMKRRNKRIMAQRAVFAGLAAILLLGLCGCKKPKAMSKERTVRVERRTLASAVSATGIIEPQVGADVKVGPRMSGLLQKLYVKVGDRVKKGQVLAELEHSQLDSAVRDAEGSVKAAKASVALDRSVLRRRKQLAGEGIISAEDLEVAEKTLAVDKAMLESALSRLSSVRIMRSYSTVRAPISGTVTAIATQEGETVAASFAVPTFVTIVDLSRMQVNAYVDEVDIGRVKVGQHATFTVDAAPADDFEGRVEAVVPQPVVRNNVVNYVAVVSIEKGPKGVLRPEMTATLSIETGKESEALLVPAAAVRYDSGGNAYVMVLKDGKPQKQTVECGNSSGGDLVVKNGLVEGEQVLVGANDGGS